MTQPPVGPSQPPYDGPPQFGPPQFGPPQYGPAPYGPPQHRKSALPWLIGGLAVILVAGGLGLALLLTNDEPAPLASTQTTQQSTDATETETETETEQSTSETEESHGSGREEDLNNDESPGLATEFMDAMIAGDYAAGRDLGTGELHREYPTPWVLGTSFRVIAGGERFSSVGIRDVFTEDATDVIVFGVVTENGDRFIGVLVERDAGELGIASFLLV